MREFLPLLPREKSTGLVRDISISSISADRMQSYADPMKEKLKDPQFWNKFALIFTVMWLAGAAALTKADLQHWAADYMFTGPLAVWILVVIIKRKLPPPSQERVE